MIEVAKEQDFKFRLSQLVGLNVSDEFGEVAGRAQYAHGQNQYLIHYKAADGCARTDWFSEHQLNAVESDEHPGCPVYDARELPPGAKVKDDHHSLSATINIHCPDNVSLSALNAQLKTHEASLAKVRGDVRCECCHVQEKGMGV